MHAATWSDVREGTAVGPTRKVDLGPTSEGVATVTALWSDVEGVVIALDVPDEPIAAAAFKQISEASTDLLQLDPPVSH